MRSVFLLAFLVALTWAAPASAQMSASELEPAGAVMAERRTADPVRPIRPPERRREIPLTERPPEHEIVETEIQSPEVAPVYYAVRRGARVVASPVSRESLAQIAFREPVRVLRREGAWSLVQYGQVRGYVETSSLSNLWIRVSKSKRLLYVYRGSELVRTLPADVSMNPVDDKVRRSRIGEHDQYRIPEGTFFVCGKNARSEYYKAFVLNYPHEPAAERGYRLGLITRDQRDRIVRAAQNFETPPMNTPLGGLIEIHGDGSGRQLTWTRGCIALRNVHMDELWNIVQVGTPVVIEP